MTWGAARPEHAERSHALTRGGGGMPASAANCAARTGGGSRGGAPIWVMREAFIPPGHWTSNQDADPDGFAVFGRFPKGWLTHVIKAELLGRIRRDELLHVCSGTLGPDEAWTVDIRPEASPRVVASGTALPFADASFKAVLLDPPYSDEYARNLYKTENPRPSWLLKEAARVVVPGGRVGILHVAIPFAPPACRLVTVWGISTGVGLQNPSADGVRAGAGAAAVKFSLTV